MNFFHSNHVICSSEIICFLIFMDFQSFFKMEFQMNNFALNYEFFPLLPCHLFI